MYATVNTNDVVMTVVLQSLFNICIRNRVQLTSLNNDYHSYFFSGNFTPNSSLTLN